MQYFDAAMDKLKKYLLSSIGKTGKTITQADYLSKDYESGQHPVYQDQMLELINTQGGIIKNQREEMQKKDEKIKDLERWQKQYDKTSKITTKTTTETGYMFMGYRLGQLEFCWDTPYDNDEIKQSYRRLYRNIFNFTVTDNINADDSSTYEKFSSSIIDQYMLKNKYIASKILVGWCVQRVSLGNQFAEIAPYARPLLNAIPDDVVDDKDLLFRVICRTSGKPLEKLEKQLDIINSMFFD